MGEDASVFRPFLPPELWMRIFHWATYNPVRDLESICEIQPFESINAFETHLECEEAFVVKRALTLVCRRWRTMLREFLYEDIWVRHGCEALANALEASEKKYGLYVRRLLLPVMQDKPFAMWDVAVVQSAKRILDCCPNVVVISRFHPYYVKAGAADEADLSSSDIPPFNASISLPSLLRVEWDNGNVFENLSRAVVEAPDFVWNCESLQVLSIGGENFPWRPDVLQQMTVVHLPNLHTLRIRSLHAFGIPGIRHYHMEVPAMRRIVLEKAEAMYSLVDGCLTRFGPQVLSVEVGKHVKFLRSDYISTILKYCPNLESLYFPIFWTKILRHKGSRRSTLSFPSVKTVGLHSVSYPDDTEARRWNQLRGHFDILVGRISKYPSLEQIVLHGNAWAAIVSNSMFINILRLVYSRDVNIICNSQEVSDILASKRKDYW